MRKQMSTLMERETMSEFSNTHNRWVKRNKWMKEWMEEYGKTANANTTTRKKGLNLVTWQSMIGDGGRSLYICPGGEGNLSRPLYTIKIVVRNGVGWSIWWETLRPMIQRWYESLQISFGVWSMSFNWHILRWKRIVVDDMSMPEDRLCFAQLFCVMLYVSRSTPCEQS